MRESFIYVSSGFLNFEIFIENMGRYNILEHIVRNWILGKPSLKESLLLVMGKSKPAYFIPGTWNMEPRFS